MLIVGHFESELVSFSLGLFFLSSSFVEVSPHPPSRLMTHAKGKVETKSKGS